MEWVTMAVTGSPAAVAAPSDAEPFEATAPLLLPADLRLTPEQQSITKGADLADQ